MSAEYKGKSWGTFAESVEELDSTDTRIMTGEDGDELVFESDNELHHCIALYTYSLESNIRKMWSSVQALEQAYALMLKTTKKESDREIAYYAEEQCATMAGLVQFITNCYNDIVKKLTDEGHVIIGITRKEALEGTRKVLANKPKKK